MPASLCLRCLERPASVGWQCSDCAESFADWTARDWRAGLALLDEHARRLEQAADRLDGAGFWAAARAILQAAEVIEDLARAIERQSDGARNAAE